MLQELARPEVSEFAVVSERLPCIKVGGKYEPIDDRARSTEAILDMLRASGGARYIPDLKDQPVAWTTRMDRLGSVGIQAVMRDGRIQARFTVVRRPSVRTMQAVVAGGKGKSSIPPAKQKSVHPPPRKSRQGMQAVKLDPRFEDEAAFERASTPGVRLAELVMQQTPLDALLYQARDQGASDVHLIAARPLLVRIGGELLPQGAAVASANADKMIGEILPERLRPTLEDQGSCDFALDRGTLGRYRVNVSKQRTGLKACFRYIRPEVPTLASLGLPASTPM